MSNNITLTAIEAKVLAKLLELAGDEFSNHGCNDFNLIREGGLAPGEAQEFMTRLQVENPDQPPEIYDYETQHDDALFRHFQQKLERGLKTPDSEVVASGRGITITAVRVSDAMREALNTGGARLPPLDYDAIERGLKS